MKKSLAALFSFCLLIAGLSAADPPGFKLHPQTMTLYIDGMECGTCMALVTQSIQDVKGVTDVDLEIIGGYANISFDPKLASVHQLAQAVADTLPVHGKPFAAALRFTIPSYAKNGNSARVDALFAKQKPWVNVEIADRAKGEFVARFRPLALDENKKNPQGWQLGAFVHLVEDPAPKGLGLVLSLSCEFQEPSPPKMPHQN
jgi:copper chaperone